MSVEVSPPFVSMPSRAEPLGVGARRHAPPQRTKSVSRLDTALNRATASQAFWLTPVLVLQALLCFRLTNGLDENEALTINSGHQMIAQLLHGTPTPAFGNYLGGVPALFAVPAAMLDHVGGPSLVHGVNSLMVLLATVLVYLSSRRTFGQGAGIIAAAIFAINPATLFVSRYASGDAPALLLLAAAGYVVTSPERRRSHPYLTALFLTTAVAEKYAVVMFVPGILAAGLVIGSRRDGFRFAWRSIATTTVTTIGLGLGWAILARNDWSGFTSTALGGRTAADVAGSTLLRDSWDYVGLIALASVAAVPMIRRHRLTTGVLCTAGLIPVGLQIAYHQSATLQRNIGLSMVFLAPVLGLLGTWLVRQGRLLGLRAPLAIAGAVALISSGMGTSAQMIHGWPSSTSIDSALRYYVHDGTQRYLVDGSNLPAYYLSDVTSYGQWASTLDPRYAGANGQQLLRDDVESAEYRLVLYRDNGATPALDRSMRSALRTRYTLVARMPVTQGKTNAYWSLWLAELPR
jgi:hypothetical protein